MVRRGHIVARYGQNTHMRASRLVSIILLLQARGRMTAAQLAGELEVSVRTVYRDVESLHTAGIPLYGDAGHRGGYQLLDGYRTQLTGLSPDEAKALSLSGLPGPAAELGLGSVLAVAQLKVRAALPPELAEQVSATARRFHLDATGWYAQAEDAPFLPAVADAVWRGDVLQVRYRRWKTPTDVDRRLEPYGLVLKAGRHRRFNLLEQDSDARVVGEARAQLAGFFERRLQFGCGRGIDALGQRGQQRDAPIVFLTQLRESASELAAESLNPFLVGEGRLDAAQAVIPVGQRGDVLHLFDLVADLFEFSDGLVASA